MSGKITGYPSKSQDFIDSDKFDVSKHVQIDSGPLSAGKEYTILSFQTGDDFSNVATVISGTINTTGCVFVATGATPTDYSNSSILAYYVTQEYSWEELKAGLGVISVKKSLTAAQIKTGNSVPILIIPAAGTGTAIKILYGSARFNGGAVGFDVGDTLNIKTGSLTTNQADFVGFGSSTADEICNLRILDSGYGSGGDLAENTAIYAKMDADSTVGDGTIDLYISYAIITL